MKDRKRKILIGRMVYEAEQRAGMTLETLIRYEKDTPNAVVARKLGVSRQLYGMWRGKVEHELRKDKNRRS